VARGTLRRLLEHGLGAPGRALLAWRTRGQAERLFAQRGLTHAATRLAAGLQDIVSAGPFRGLHYPRHRGDIVHLAKLLGAYERELHVAVERLILRQPRLIVNVGSGDGYYAVGLARRLSAAGVTTRVVAVDPDPLAQRACRATARRNVVADMVVPMVRVDTAMLERLLRQARAAESARLPEAPPSRSLVLVDAEGFEDALLDPVRAPALAQTDLLVETHDFAAPGVTARLTARFERTHDVERIEVAARDAADFPLLAGEPAAVSAGLVDEFRHQPQSWLVLTARAVT